MSHTRSEVIFSSRLQLQQWAAALPVYRRPLNLRLQLDQLRDPQRLQWQQQLQRSHNDCGCSAAAAAFLGSILLIIGYAVVAGFEQPVWMVAIATVLTSIAALFVGKTLGHLWSRRKLRHQVAQLIHLVEQTDSDEPR